MYGSHSVCEKNVTEDKIVDWDIVCTGPEGQFDVGDFAL